MNLLVMLDIQHSGKPLEDAADLGAGADLDHDGKVETHEMEARLTPHYASAASRVLVEQGAHVAFLTQGTYSGRHAEACRLARRFPGVPAAYIACHFNAGGGGYGLVAHHAASVKGHALAVAVAGALKALPELRGDARVVAASRAGAWSNAYATMDGIYQGPAWLSGICFEPCFLDQPGHASLLTASGLERIGGALAQGILSWASSKT